MEIINNNLKVSVPDALIVGAAKAGTTSLFNYLSDHPQIFKPRIKEPWFFSFRGKQPQFIIPNSGRVNSKEIISDDQQYFALFKNSGDKYLIEGSTSYLYTAKKTINNIKEIYGDEYYKLKIVIVLRNPIQRAWSHYMMHIRDNKTKLSFKDSIKSKVINKRLTNGGTIGYDYIGFGMYYHQVKLFMQTFSNLQILMYDDFAKNPLNTLNTLTDFLGLDRHIFSISDRHNISGSPKNKIYNFISNLVNRESFLKSFVKYFFSESIVFRFTQFLKTVLYKKVNLMEDDKKKLIKIYHEEIISLEEMIDVDLQHWLK